MTLEEGVGQANRAGLAALFYPSASYTDAKPRWRMLLPTSRLLPPGERAKLVARVNGLYGGIFSPESFVRSQAYYFGSVGDNPAHRVVVTEGDYVDQRDDLDAGAIGKGGKDAPGNGASKPDADPFAQFARDAKRPTLAKVTAAVMAIPNDEKVDRAQWVDVGRAIKREYPVEGLGIYLQWSGGWAGWTPKLPWDEGRIQYTIKTWRSFAPHSIGAGTLFRLANEASPGWWERAQEDLKTDPPNKENSGDRKTRLMQTSAEFVAGFVPPDYLVDGLMQRRYVYSFTGPTGSGKTAVALRIGAHVAHGLELAGKEVERGRVLFFAGENPDDVRSRWILLCEEMGKDPNTMDVVFMPFTPNLSEKQIRARIDAEAAEHGPFSLLIVDTSAAYYSGDDENDNKQLGDHARLLRTFVELPGGPTILVTCHPVKSPNMENLLPLGGGAFLAEVDGNLVCIKDAGTMTVEVTTHGKFRGPDFAPFSFRLVAGRSEKLVDSKGRQIWSICAQPISNEEQEAIEKAGHSDQDRLLRAMLDQPGRSLTELAEDLLWRTMDGRPNKTKVYRMMKDWQKAKLVELRRDGHYVLTAKGEAEAEKTPESRVKME